MKKIFSIILVFVLAVLSLSACKSDSDNDSDNITLYVLEDQWSGMGNSAIYYVYNKKADEKDKIELLL